MASRLTRKTVAPTAPDRETHLCLAVPWVPLKHVINASTGAGVAGALAYLLYRGDGLAVVIDTVFDGVRMLTQPAFHDLPAKSCPRRAEVTFLAGQRPHAPVAVTGGVASGRPTAFRILTSWSAWSPQ
jgi:hypothetical protein